MWDTVLTTYKDVSESAEQSYLTKARSQYGLFDMNEYHLTE